MESAARPWRAASSHIAAWASRPAGPVSAKPALRTTAASEALRVLAPDVTLAFAPYGSSLDRWMQRARSDGHELLLQIPMEPFDYPDNDPGPQTLLTSLFLHGSWSHLIGNLWYLWIFIWYL